jgi:hypothetical protein
MNKGYAFGFLLILLVLILGFYVAYTGFVSSREALRSQQPSESDAEVAQATSILFTPTSQGLAPAVPLSQGQVLTLEITATLAITPVPGAIPTVQPAAPVVPPTQPPSAPATQATSTMVPPTLPTSTAMAPPGATDAPPAQPPTPVASPAYQYRLAGPPTADPDYSICCYIYGTVRDAAGNGLEGVAVQVANEWNPPVVAVTKGGGEIGKYDIPINAAVTDWEISLVDVAGNQISTKVQIKFDASLINGYRVEWQRTY